MVMICPDEKTLSSYLDRGLSGIERRTIERHIADCSRCLDLLLVAYEAQGKRLSTRRLRRLARTISSNILRGSGRITPKYSSSEAEGRVEKKRRTELKWLISALILFALSFIVRRYFLQFLTASAVLGFKWAMEGEGAKRVIMIFKGMHKDQMPSDIHHDSPYHHPR